MAPYHPAAGVSGLLDMDVERSTGSIEPLTNSPLARLPAKEEAGERFAMGMERPAGTVEPLTPSSFTAWRGEEAAHGTGKESEIGFLTPLNAFRTTPGRGFLPSATPLTPKLMTAPPADRECKN